MRLAPDGVHRERLGESRPATWYVIWLGEPHAEGSVILGRTKRLRRHRWHRVFPEAPGAQAKEIEGHIAAMEWLLRLHRGEERPD